MIVIKRIADLQKVLAEYHKTGQKLGFVPTMGALHAGHISLINNSRQSGDLVIASIFVNPTQFNDPKDFEKYPVTIEKDIDMLESAGCDILFLPHEKEIYPDGRDKLPHYDLGYLETVLEGKYRPGHFQGVCQVVHRLLNIVKPGRLYLGQKDFQQCMVIKKMVEITGLSTIIIICDTLRETDGLAMSSRNMRLSATERSKAVRISETLQYIKQQVRPGFIGDITLRAEQYLVAEGFVVDYVSIANADNLALLNNWDGQTKIVSLVAVYLNEVRLIDNMLLH
jgi:pantoate--beta-alanine ligase